MPMIDILSHTDEATPMDLGVYRTEDEDEMYLKRLSVYATLRPNDLKRQESDRRTTGCRSLKDLLQEWNVQTVEEKTECEPEADTWSQALRSHELPVKGFEIDDRIAPGFRYSVRYVGKDEYLFDGEARRLDSIGLGYGRRLTFQGDRLNFNDCYFWSDSAPTGFAFNIEAIRVGDTFTINDSESQPIGEVEVQRVEFPQTEKETFIDGTTVVKHVEVRFACSIKHFSHYSSLVNITSQDFEVVEGIAELVKTKGSKEAVVRGVKDVFFQTLGKCSLHVE